MILSFGICNLGVGGHQFTSVLTSVLKLAYKSAKDKMYDLSARGTGSLSFTTEMNVVKGYSPATSERDTTGGAAKVMHESFASKTR